MVCDKLWPFLAHFEQKLDKRKKRGAYKQAVEEALVAAQTQAEAISQAGDDEDSEDEGSGWVNETTNSLPPASFRSEPIKPFRGGRRGPRRKSQQPQPPPSAPASPLVVDEYPEVSSPTTENGASEKVIEPTFSGDESETEGQLIIDPGVPPQVSHMNYVLQLSNSTVTTSAGCIDPFPISTAAHVKDTTTWT